MPHRMGLLGKKVGMTQDFDAKGIWRAVSVIEVGPCVVLDLLTPERNGYAAVKLGFDDKNPRHSNKPEKGIFAKANSSPKRFVREIRVEPAELEKFELGQVVELDEVFAAGDVVDIVGISRGKGFQGVMKRYHYKGFRATHGTHEYFRHGGSIGCRLTPGRVFKGTKMPGHMGNKRITVQNVRVVEVIGDKNLLLVTGSVPGAPDCHVMIKQAAKRPARPFSPKPKQAEPAPEPVSEPAEAAPAADPAE